MQTRKRYYIDREELAKVYEGHPLQALGDLQQVSGVIPITNGLPQKLEVTQRNNSGPFTTVTISQFSKANYLIVPTELIKTEEVPMAKEIFRSVLERYFPGRYYMETAGLWLHYPKLIITNSLNQSHTIHDFLVRLRYDESRGTLVDMVGARVSMSSLEINFRYQHSHLDRVSQRQLSVFCLGSGTPFHKLVTHMKTASVVSAFDFEVFLDQLEAYLCWESLEGNPYISIRELITPNRGTSSFTVICVPILPTIRTLAEHFLEALLPYWELGEEVCVEPTNYGLVVNPDLNISVWLQIERDLGAKLSIDSTFSTCFLPFNWVAMHWVRNNSTIYSQTLELYPMDRIVADAVAHLNITPRLIPQEIPVQDTTQVSPRLSSNMTRLVLLELNNIMIDARQ